MQRNFHHGLLAQATWKDGALHFSYQVNLPESESVGFTEIWSVSDDKQTLTVERSRDGGRHRTLVFLRVAEPGPKERSPYVFRALGARHTRTDPPAARGESDADLLRGHLV